MSAPASCTISTSRLRLGSSDSAPRKSLLAAYDAVKALKAKGKLEDADRATELSAPLAAKLSEPRLPQRVREHIHALAAKDLLENVTHPTKDETLRQLLAEHFGGSD